MQMMLSQGHLICSQLPLHTSAGLSGAKQGTRGGRVETLLLQTSAGVPETIQF